MIFFIKGISVIMLSFIISYLVNKMIIIFERKRKIGQSINKYLILDKHKEFTPSMGGVGIYCSIIISSLIYIEEYKNKMLIMIILTYSFFFILGFIDDYIKVKHKNYYGLSSFIRFISELVFALGISYILLEKMGYKEELHLSNNLFINIFPFGLIIFPLMIVGCSNSVNLTDGIDSLASLLLLLAFMPLLSFSIKGEVKYISYFLLSVYGSLLGFIVFNIHPAKLFMGDSSSLPLGASLSLICIILKKELLLILLGAIFIFETMSVILQVIFFKTKGKRLFLMAPYHHHLRILGMSEEGICIIFFLIQFILSFLTLFIGEFL